MERLWDTSAVAEHERFAYWREVVCAAFVDMHPERHQPDPFEGRVLARELGPVRLARIAAGAQRVRRTEADVEACPAAVVFVNVQLSGTGVMRQGGREAVLRAGDLAMVDALRPHELAFDADFRQLCLTIPHALLAPHVTAIEAMTAVRLGGERPLGRLVAGVAREAAQVAGEDDMPGVSALAEHVAGLVALALRAAAPAPALSPARTALLQAALDDVERHLTDPDLGPAAIAARVGISVRYLHKLFAARGETLSRWILRRRLDACRRDLADPAFAHWPVAAIAARHGFTDPSGFSRAFRVRFRCSPRAYRSAGRPPAVLPGGR